MKEGFSLNRGRRILATGLMFTLDKILIEKKIKDLLVLPHTTVTPDVNDYVAELVVVKKNVKKTDPDALAPCIVIEIIEHRYLSRTKEKMSKIGLRFPKADLFILEFAEREKDHIEKKLKWHKLVDGKFEEKNNYSIWLDEKIKPDRRTLRNLTEAIAIMNKAYAKYLEEKGATSSELTDEDNEDTDIENKEQSRPTKKCADLSRQK